MFETIEKIEKDLYSPCKYLTLKNVVTFGRKNNSSGRRMDAVYSRSFPSQKYSDYGELNSLRVQTSDFLVLSYSRENEFFEIYVSYPHIKRLVEGLQTMNEAMHDDNMWIEQEDGLYLNADYEKFSVRVKNLTNGKSIIMVPSIITDDRDGELAGVLLYLGQESNVVEIAHDAFDSLVYFLEGFNLLQSSMVLTNMASLYLVQNGGVVAAPSGGGQGAQKRTPPKPNVRDRKIAGGAPSRNTPFSDSEPEEQGDNLKSRADELFDDEPEQESEPETRKPPQPKASAPKSSPASRASSGTKGTGSKIGAAALMAQMEKEDGPDFSEIPDIPDEDLPF